MTDNIFELASRKKVRFVSTVGRLTVEDLWEADLTLVDQIAIALNKQIKETEEASFLSKNRTDETLELKFELVKHVIEVRLAEIEAAKQKSLAQQQKQQLLEILNRKENQQLEELSLEELKERINALEA